MRTESDGAAFTPLQEKMVNIDVRVVCRRHAVSLLTFILFTIRTANAGARWRAHHGYTKFTVGTHAILLLLAASLIITAYALIYYLEND